MFVLFCIAWIACGMLANFIIMRTWFPDEDLTVGNLVAIIFTISLGGFALFFVLVCLLAKYSDVVIWKLHKK